MSANVVGKIVYLAGPKGPEEFILNGVWLRPASEVATPTKRVRRTRAQIAADNGNGDETDVENGNGTDDGTEPVFTDRSAGAKPMGRPRGSKNKPKNGATRSHKRGGGQGSIGG